MDRGTPTPKSGPNNNMEANTYNKSYISVLKTRLRRSQLLRMTRYSRFLLRSVFNTFLRPPLVLFLISKTGILSFFPRHWVWTASLYILSIPVSEAILAIQSSKRKRRECKELGATPIPKVVGKRLGNFDVLKELIAAEENEYPGDIFLRWAKQYGPTYDMNILWASQIVTIDPENVRFVLSSEFSSFEKGEKFHDMLESFWGEGIFTTDGDTWRTHRANARPFFAQERLSDFAPFEFHAQKLLEIIDGMATDKQSFDLQDLFARYTLDTATEFLFGLSTNCLDGVSHTDKDAEYEHFMKAVNELALLSARRIRIGSTWPLFELTGDKSIAPTRVIDRFVEPIVAKALQRTRDSAQDAKDSNFLEHLAHVTKDPKAVRDESLNILFAARDTTSCLLTFTAYLLMEHPDVADKMHEEVTTICGLHRSPDSNDIKKMKYVEAVLNETLRLFPPVPYNIRRSVEASALPSPQSGHGRQLYMPPRSSITYAPILMQRDPHYWGDDACDFNPDRWLSGSSPFTHPNAFVPFNAGPRICLGQQLAYIQASYVWARILQLPIRLTRDIHTGVPAPSEWKKTVDNNSRHARETIWPHSDFVLRVKGGLWVHANED